MKRETKAKTALPKDIGSYSRDVDVALPVKHTKEIYNTLNKNEASLLAQLRTGMVRIYSYLHRIGVFDTVRCDYGAAKEIVMYFLFLYAR